MRNTEEFSGQRPGLARVLPAYLRPSAGDGPGTDRIRYAHSGALPRDEPFRPVTQGTAGHHRAHAEPGDARGVANGGSLGGGSLGGGSLGGGDLGGEAWLTEFPAGNRHTDLWVLVCGGIAAVAAFAAAFVASGGVASHPAAPGASVPAVVSQACPSPAPAPSP
jgi:hypothetical protein